MRPIDRQALIDVIADAKRTDPETGSFVGWLADCLVEYLKQPNEPLTLDELRKMDGKPVYLVVDDGFETAKNVGIGRLHKGRTMSYAYE